MDIYNPKILLEPTLPPPLMDKAPNKILGGKWWKEVRKKAEDKLDGRCHCCGIHKDKTRKGRLEGHELYNIDYKRCTVELKEVVVLCRRCHNYIHVGNLIRQYADGSVGRKYLRIVLDNGIKLLDTIGEQPQATHAIHWLIHEKGYSEFDAKEYVIKAGLAREKFNPDSWDGWMININGEVYEGITQKEWLNEG